MHYPYNPYFCNIGLYQKIIIYLYDCSDNAFLNIMYVSLLIHYNNYIEVYFLRAIW